MKDKENEGLEIDTNFVARGFKIVDEISKNTCITIDLNSTNDVESAVIVRDLTKMILSNCKVEGAQDIEIQFDMDCSQDEKIARELNGLV
jgi:phosphoribosylformylglycinamidine (FGAM) synthase PurS component